MFQIFSHMFLILQSSEYGDSEKETLHTHSRKGNTQEIKALLQQNEGQFYYKKKS